MGSSNKLSKTVGRELLHLLALIGQVIAVFCFEKSNLWAGYFLTFLAFGIIIVLSRKDNMIEIKLPKAIILQWALCVVFSFRALGNYPGILLVPLYPVGAAIIAVITNPIKINTAPAEKYEQKTKANAYPRSFQDALALLEMTSKFLKGEKISRDILMGQINFMKQSLRLERWNGGNVGPEEVIDYLLLVCNSRPQKLEKEQELLIGFITQNEE